MSELDITEKRYKQIMGRRTIHRHNYQFAYPVFGFHTSYAVYYCDCGDEHAIGDGYEMTPDEAREWAEADWDATTTEEVLGESS